MNSGKAADLWNKRNVHDHPELREPCKGRMREFLPAINVIGSRTSRTNFAGGLPRDLMHVRVDVALNYRETGASTTRVFWWEKSKVTNKRNQKSGSVKIHFAEKRSEVVCLRLRVGAKMAYKISYTNNPNFPSDGESAAVFTATVEEARGKAKELKDCGFKNVIVFDTKTNKALEVY